MDERKQELLRCTECDSVYTGWAWPDDPPQILGEDRCSTCGSVDFEVINDASVESDD